MVDLIVLLGAGFGLGFCVFMLGYSCGGLHELRKQLKSTNETIATLEEAKRIIEVWQAEQAALDWREYDLE